MKTAEVDFIYNLERIHGTLKKVSTTGNADVWELIVQKLYWGQLFRTGADWDFQGGYYTGKKFADKLASYLKEDK